MTLVVSKLKVTQLKAELASRNLPTTGLKAVLSERLQQALDQEAAKLNNQNDSTSLDQTKLHEKRSRSPSLNLQERPNKITNCSIDPLVSFNQKDENSISDESKNNLVDHKVIDENHSSNGHPSVVPSSTHFDSQSNSINTNLTLPQAQLIHTTSPSDSSSHITHPVTTIPTHLDNPITEQFLPSYLESKSLIANHSQNSTTSNVISVQSDPADDHPADKQPKPNLEAEPEPVATLAPEPLPTQTSTVELPIVEPSNLEPSVNENIIQTQNTISSPGKLEPETLECQAQLSIVSKVTTSESTPDVVPSQTHIPPDELPAEPTTSEPVNDVQIPPANVLVSPKVQFETKATQSQDQISKHSNTNTSHLKTDLDSSESNIKHEPFPQPQIENEALMNVPSNDLISNIPEPSKEQGETQVFDQSHPTQTLEPLGPTTNGSIVTSERKIESQTDTIIDVPNTIETTESPHQAMNVDFTPVNHSTHETIPNPSHTLNDISDLDILASTTSQPQPIPNPSISPSFNDALDHSSSPSKAVSQPVDHSVLPSEGDHPSQPIINDVASPSNTADKFSNQPASTPIVSREPPSDVEINEAIIDIPTKPEPEKIDQAFDADEPPPTRSLYIRNLVRPLTVNQLKKKLSEFGEVDYFWIDSIRSHAYVTFQKDSAAQATYRSLHRTTPWPPETGKILTLIFIPEEEVSRLVSEEEETLRSYGGRLGLHIMRENDRWKFELRQVSNGILQQPRGLASSIPSSQVNNMVRSQTLDAIHPKELPRSRTDVNLNLVGKNTTEEEPVLQFDLPENYPKGGPEKWFKKTETKPHLFYSPSLP